MPVSEKHQSSITVIEGIMYNMEIPASENTSKF